MFFAVIKFLPYIWLQIPQNMEATQTLVLANIKRIRHEKKLTQKDVAEGSGMLVPTYSRLERGGSNPSLSSMVRISKALGIEVIELLRPMEIKDRTMADKMELISQLSESDRGIVELLIDTVLEKSRLEKILDNKTKKRLAELNAIRKQQ